MAGEDPTAAIHSQRSSQRLADLPTARPQPSPSPAPLTWRSPLLALHRLPNGLWILLAVALLMQGPVGAFEALWNYSAQLLCTLLGGEQLFLDVFMQTAPLTIAVACIVVGYRGGAIRWTNPISIAIAGVIVVTGAWFGGELRSGRAKRRAALALTSAALPASTMVGKDSTTAFPVSFRLRSQGLQNDLTSASVTTQEDSQPAPISIAEAFEQLSQFGAPATAGGHDRWKRSIPRVAAIPEPESLLGVVARAINQLLGFLVVYRPRLFLASVLLGSYIGWTWHPILDAVRRFVTQRAGPMDAVARR